MDKLTRSSILRLNSQEKVSSRHKIRRRTHTRRERRYLGRSNILSKLATAVKASPHIIPLPITPLAPVNHHPQLDGGKGASLLASVLHQLLNPIQLITSPISVLVARLKRFQFIRIPNRMAFNCGPSCFKSSENASYQNGK